MKLAPYTRTVFTRNYYASSYVGLNIPAEPRDVKKHDLQNMLSGNYHTARVLGQQLRQSVAVIGYSTMGHHNDFQGQSRLTRTQ